MSSSGISSHRDSRRQTHIPAAALKRFANDLDREGSNTFVNINRARVHEFIEKGQIVSEAANAKTTPKKKTTIAGVNDYTTKSTELPSFIHLQNKSEFQSGLGCRSRFGEGDGSFFDQWLNCDVVKSKHIVDKDGLPVMKFCLTQTQTGYKRHMNDHKVGNDGKAPITYVKTYAERRAERLAAEKAATSTSVDLPKTVSTQSSSSNIEKPHSAAADLSGLQCDTRASTANDFRLPPINGGVLSATDRENYFGDQARTTFFEYYRQLARQQYTIGQGKAGKGALDTSEEELESLRTDRREEMEFFRDQDAQEEAEAQLKRSRTAEQHELLMSLRGENKPLDGVSFAKKPLIIATDSDDTWAESGMSGSLLPPDHAKAGDDGNTKKSTSRRTHFQNLSVNTQNSSDVSASITHNTAEEKRLLWKHLAEMPASMEPSRPSTAATGGASPRPLSARSKFLLGCVRRDIPPQPGILIRREVTTILNIASMGIGNEVAALLAESLETLPLLEGLCIDDNGLTDAGLVPIVNKLGRCLQLKSFDLSNNKVDSATADALQVYLASPSCNLLQLIMRNADIDDNEASRFMLAIAARFTIQELDLSQNILGSHEFAIRKEELTAGESIGRLLEDPQCSIRSLKLSWNMIRYHSGVALMRSLAVNRTLTYLDVSYNGLGVEGGECLGNSLHSNQSLVYLNISHNNITARAAFTIMSGVRTCQTLSEVDFSENPIGEEGAKAQLALNMMEGHRLSVNIKGCSLRIADPKCWFDSHNDVEKEYTLQLNRPYDRAVCIEMLRLVTQNEGLIISKYLYQGPEDTQPNELNLTLTTAADLEPAPTEGARLTHSNTARSSFVSNASWNHSEGGSTCDSPLASNHQQLMYEIATDIDTAREVFRSTANRIFQQYDVDESGSLDKDELYDVLKQLGMQGSGQMVDRLLSVYDTDNSGRVEEEEFVNFLTDIKQNYERNMMFGNERRYLYSAGIGPLPTDEEGNVISSTRGPGAPKPVEYFPPEDGKVTIKLTGQRTLPDFVQTISQESVETMLNSAKQLQDSSMLFACALTVVKLDFNEAKTFYRVMLKDIGNETTVLLRLLPRMSSPADARLLISFVTNNDFLRLHALKVMLGPVYRIYIGIPNGFYRLNLAEEKDFYVMQRLVELSNTFSVHRKKAELGDTSQTGNWSGFRNTVLDGRPFLFTNMWLESLPDKGKVEFDFVSFEHVSEREMIISNLRLFRLLFSMGLVEEEKRKRIFVKLKFNGNEGRAAARGSGVKKWETAPKTAENVHTKLQKLYASVAHNRKPIDDTAITPEELVYVEMKKNGVKFTPTLSSLSVSQPASPGDDKVPPKLGVESTDGSLMRMGSSLTQESGEANTFVETFDTHIKLMIDSGLASANMIAARTMDVLESTLAGRFLNCVQLALIVQKFPDGSELYNEYSTYRVELVVRLFSRLVDVINFDYVLKELEQHEYAMVVLRLGWLNVWNPLKAEGAIYLDLSRREERQVARMLIVLNYVESKHTWVEPYYRPPGTTELPDETFKVPSSWYSESTLPSAGVLSLTYFSGKGMGLLDCNPDVTVRMKLMACVLAKPLEEDSLVFGLPSLAEAECVLLDIGCKLSFMTERQIHTTITAHNAAGGGGGGFGKGKKVDI